METFSEFNRQFMNKRGVLKDLEQSFNELIYNLHEKKEIPLESGYKKTLLYQNKELDFDIFQIIWFPNCKTHIHDHADNGCLLRLAEGSLVETKYTSLEEIKEIKQTILTEKDNSYIDNHIGVHSIANPNKDIAVSYHLYSPSGYKTNYHVKNMLG